MPKKEKPPRQRLHLQTGNELPAGYKPQRSFSLADDWLRLLALNFFGAFACLLFGWLALIVGFSLRPSLGDEIIGLASQPILVVISANLAGAAILYGCHELVHGLMLYYYTRTRPQVGFNQFYIRLSVPGWYFPRGELLITLLAPLVVLTLAGWLLLQVIPIAIALALIFGLAMNVACSVGDCFIAVWLFRQHPNTLFESLGDTVNAYDSN
jgi:Putative zincin peptidase